MYTPGNFTQSAISASVMKESEMLGTGGRSLAELNVPIVAGAAILRHQDPTIMELFNGSECISAKVSALRTDAAAVALSATLSCDIPEGNKAGTDGFDVTKKVLTNPVFMTIKQKECNNAFTWEQRLAHIKLKAKVLLEIELTKKLILMLGTEADAPVAGWYKKTAGTIVGNSYNVTAANFKPELYADILYRAGLNNMNMPIMINGSNFFHESFLTQFKGIACCDNNQVLTNAPWQVYFDTRHVDTTLGGDFTLVLDKNALLFWSSPVFSEVVTEMPNDTMAWAEPLPRLKAFYNGAEQDIMVDIRAQKICVNGGTDIEWRFEFVLRGALEVNLPDYENKQGILKIRQV